MPPENRSGGELHPGQRIELMLANELEDQIRMVNRRLEVMASEALRLDQVNVNGDGYPTRVMQFSRHAGHTVVLEGDNRWGNPAFSRSRIWTNGH